MKNLFYIIVIASCIALMSLCLHLFCDTHTETIAEPAHTVVLEDRSPVGTYNWFTIVIAGFALVVSIIAWRSQEKVAENTSMLSYKAQEQALFDLVRHLYRNMVVMWAIVNKMTIITKKNLSSENASAEKYAAYPSELHLIKAQAPIDNIHPELFVSNDNNYSDVNNLLLQLRNYNTELVIAANQLKDESLTKEVKDFYIDTLLFKPANLTNLVIEVLASLKGFGWRANIDIYMLNTLDKYCPKLWNPYMKLCNKEYMVDIEKICYGKKDERNKNYIAEMRKILIKRNLPEIVKQCENIISNNHKKNEEDNPIDKRGTIIEEYSKIMPYTKYIFKDESAKFLTMLNADSQIECGKNKSGADKLLVIPF